ncbi:MAG TPA: hypothetical protein VNA31_08030 [bacterium]|nr:hypothetical protein [bacterium]
MLNINITKLAQTQTTIDVQVTVTGIAQSPGISDIEITSFDLISLDSRSAKCPANLVYSLQGIPITSLPLYADAYECPVGVDQGQAVGAKTSAGPFLRAEAGIADCKAPGQNVNNPVCIQLQKEIQTLRNSILNLCPQWTSLKGQRDAAFQVMQYALAAAAVLAAGAAAAPWPVSVVLGVLAGIAAGVGVAAGLAGFVLQGKLDVITGKLDRLRHSLASLVDRLRDVCCTEFINVAQDVPLCP